MIASPHLLSSICYLLPLVWLWFRLIDHLRIEWAVNPAYGYGWAVPLLCAYLAWQRVRRKAPFAGSANPKMEDGSEQIETASPYLPSSIFHLLLVALAFLYAPTRLIQEANPEWRLISWALAVIVLGLTLLCFRMNASTFQRFNVSTSALVFPICFFLVAVPWPTIVEGRLIQGLTSANVTVTIELLGLCGIPAVQHGNIIEISSGVVGVDEACSGIRSFQATLMLSLFFGELYSLTVPRRVFCVFLGFALSFIFNACRTLLLTVVASFQGVKAIENWHDPAGITVLVWCFAALWFAALVLKGGQGKTTGRQEQGTTRQQDYGTTGQQERGTTGQRRTENIEHPTSNIEHRTAKGGTTDQGNHGTTGQGKTENIEHPTSNLQHRTPDSPALASIGGSSTPSTPNPKSFNLRLQTSDFRLRTFAFGLIAWLVLVEVGVEWWYRSHEKNVPPTMAWSAAFPADNTAFRELPLTEKVQQLLRYDEGRNCAWREEDGTRWQGIYLRWNPGKIAVHLAKSHTPEVCLSAAGRKMVAKADLQTFEAGGLQLPFFAYVFQGPQDRLHVFYCLWEDRAVGQEFDTESLTYGKRLAPVLAGRRNSGQRTLELAVWGIENQEQAAAAVQKQLKKIIRVQPGQ